MILGKKKGEKRLSLNQGGEEIKKKPYLEHKNGHTTISESGGGGAA